MIEPNGAPQESVDELKAKIAQLEADKVSIVGELTDTRPKLREKDEAIKLLSEQLVAAAKKNEDNPEEAKIAAIVAKTLQQRDGERAAGNRKAAFEKFVNEHKEYHPDNDTGGIKRAALEKELGDISSWNTVVETEDLVAVIRKADGYLRGGGTSRQTQVDNPYSSSSPSFTAPTGTPTSKLTPLEKELVERNGWTEDKFLKMKELNPGIVRLIAPVQQ